MEKWGGSAYGAELYRLSHLHYEIQEKVGDKWVSINPSKTGQNNIDDLFDPQTWILPEYRYDYIKPLPQFKKESAIGIDNMRVENKNVELNNGQ